MRKFAIIAAASLLAMASASQALSNALADDNPALAASLSPYAAPALEKSAVALVTADPETNSVDFTASEPAARQAVDAGLLSTEALAILAMQGGDPQTGAAILEAAQAASRRGRVINSAALIAALEAEDNALLLAALNRTLLLYPSQQDTTVPLMVEQLANERLLPAFVDIFETEPLWGAQFFREAVLQPELADNIARVRLGLSPDTVVDYEADRAILRLLARTQKIDEAAQLFARIRSLDSVPVARGSLGWEDEYTPFHWQFYDQDNRFARKSTDGDSIMISTRGGYGGVLARRLIRLGDTTTVFQVEHTLDPSASGRVRLTLECPGSEQRWSDTLGPSPTMMRLDRDLGCEYAWLGIAARAPNGGDVISGQILDITIM